MEQNRPCTPHNEEETHQAIHWARLAANNDPNHNITIIITPDTNWYHNSNPHLGPFPDSHIIVLFEADSMTYKEPTIPPEIQTPRLNHQPYVSYVYTTKLEK